MSCSPRLHFFLVSLPLQFLFTSTNTQNVIQSFLYSFIHLFIQSILIAFHLTASHSSPLPSSTRPSSPSFPPFIAPVERSPFFVGLGVITLSSNRSFNNQIPQLNQDAGAPLTFPGWYLVLGKGEGGKEVERNGADEHS